MRSRLARDLNAALQSVTTALLRLARPADGDTWRTTPATTLPPIFLTNIILMHKNVGYADSRLSHFVTLTLFL